MQKENNETTEVNEPKIESRFGFEKTRKTQSAFAVKAFAIGTTLCLGSILWFRSPDNDLNQSGGVKSPESSEINSNSNQYNLQTYSVETDRNLQVEKSKKSKNRIIVSLPGVQKIDRNKSGLIPMGSEISAKLLTGASNGLIKAQAINSLTHRGETFIAAGDLLIGQGQTTDERLLITFNRVIHEDGSHKSIHGDAIDQDDKLVGLAGSKFKRYAYRYGSAVGLNFVGGMTEGLQDRTVVGQQVVTTPSIKNALLNGASKAALEMANDQMSELKNQPPPISVPAGTEIVITFSGNE